MMRLHELFAQVQTLEGVNFKTFPEGDRPDADDSAKPVVLFTEQSRCADLKGAGFNKLPPFAARILTAFAVPEIVIPTLEASGLLAPDEHVFEFGG